MTAEPCTLNPRQLASRCRMRNRLTHKQDLYAQNVANGMTGADAYRNAYDARRMSDNSIYVEASRLFANPKIALRIKAVRERIWWERHLTKQALVARIMESSREAREAGQFRASLKGLEIAGKMIGAI